MNITFLLFHPGAWEPSINFNIIEVALSFADILIIAPIFFSPWGIRKLIARA